MRNSRFFVAAVLLAAGGLGPASARAQAPSKDPAKPPVVTAEAVSMPLAPATYNANGRRDPFKNLLTGKDINERRVITGLSDLMIDEITVIGLVKRKGRFEAVIGMASGFPMSAREGDKFADGYVLSIGDNQIVLRKTRERGVPLLKPKDIVKEITSEER
jgi:Tfp pilus assembly protein PilP